MTFDPYAYTDPYEAARQVQQFPNMPASMTPLQPPVGPAQPFTTPLPVVEGGPLGDLQDQTAAVLNSADHRNVYIPGPGGALLRYPRGRQQSVLGDMVKGALLGFGGWLLWRHLRARKQATGQYFRRGTRAAMMWVAITIAGAVAAHILWPGSFWMATATFCAAGFVWGQIYGRAMRLASEKRAGGHRR
jgi:hypothetical protein